MKKASKGIGLLLLGCAVLIAVLYFTDLKVNQNREQIEDIQIIPIEEKVV